MPGVFASSLILWMALFSNISAYGQRSVNSSQKTMTRIYLLRC